MAFRIVFSSLFCTLCSKKQIRFLISFFFLHINVYKYMHIYQCLPVYLVNIFNLKSTLFTINCITFLFFIVNCVQLVAYISQHGLHGELRFLQQNDNSIKIESRLETTLQYPDQLWSWSIYEMPTDYREIETGRRCHPSNFGSKLIELDSHLGYLQLPGNESTTWHLSSDISGEYYSVFYAKASVDLMKFSNLNCNFRQNKYLGTISGFV